MKRDDLKLYLVTDRALSLGRSLEEVVAEAVKGGVTMVQLREKDAPTGEFVELARRLVALLRPQGIPLIINDRADVALAADADGLHIGQSDMCYADARRLLGPDKIIGLSVENLTQVEEANGLDVDYIGISPIYGTPTKTDTATPFGLEELRKAVELSAHPTVAIGGMNSSTVADVFDAGVDGAAVVSAICSAPSPRAAAEELCGIIDEHKTTSWTRQVWEASLPIYKRIIAHPFIKELADGTLAQERFVRYLAQDEIYIRNYGEEMFLLADMLPEGPLQDMFRAYAKDGMDAEKAMHDMLIERFGIDTAVEASDVTKAYMAHTRGHINSGSLPHALAAMLPCMWIYNEVGRYIYANRNTAPNPYSDWVATYASEEFTEGTREVLRMCDRYAAEASAEVRAEMDEAYLRAAELEWAFWDYGYNGK